MILVERELDVNAIEALRERTLRKLGYRSGLGVDPIIVGSLDKALVTATRVAKLKGIYRVLPVLGTSKSGVETPAGVIRSAMFSHLVDICRGKPSVVFMIATIGGEFEEIGRANSSVFNQLIYDAVGSELTEMMADQLEADCRGKVDSSGLRLSSRFSPGYCDWSLEGQRAIFSSLDANLINVRLTSHLVMVPNKSVSAIAVVSGEMPVQAPCAFCTSGHCPWRRLPFSLGDTAES
jgi:hypothetical protein